MDGVKVLLPKPFQGRTASLCALVAVMVLLASGARADAPQPSKRRGALQQFSGNRVALHPISSPKALPAVTLRPEARVIDARKSPIVAVVSGVQADSNVNLHDIADNPGSQIHVLPLIPNENDQSHNVTRSREPTLTVEEALKVPRQCHVS